MTTNPHTLTRARAGSTTDFGYRSLGSFAGPVPSHLLMPPAATTPAAAFGQGIGDGISSQPHHELRNMLVGYVVGRMVGQAIARVRNR